ncbi:MULTISPECIES: DUF397 domain-containing protein [Streptomyces]|uniref:DUF397 domain-containing protein n=1 Tax=Streptomyces TaxID=1883 RepID=UPI001885488B|nr:MULTISPECIES: DUF397 domain-containing protein [Streptomyces]MBF8174742.1 DUF397 domain-containing protein [Streptomyces olivaceus]MBZ6134259.1 DUF397 domain-containing protein [Streptomyces olivaceus]MBZ6139416.1 DUF397 domain-containing protein [Streptomyces olivaceus]MBZ6167171.1 DUF397 domain-containing protein [Streptomyces olivaceus]MBZ6173762.1 DUF397 domain-containing protein [Streptomyces olivaceus]
MTDVLGTFRKSSYSQAESNCVEVAVTASGARAIRDSKRQDDLLLVISREGWRAFLGRGQ